MAPVKNMQLEAFHLRFDALPQMMVQCPQLGDKYSIKTSVSLVTVISSVGH